MKFGEKVRDLRKKHSLTQDELAKCLGVSKRTVIGWERDGRYPRNVEILEKMADIFHVPLTYIFLATSSRVSVPLSRERWPNSNTYSFIVSFTTSSQLYFSQIKSAA